MSTCQCMYTYVYFNTSIFIDRHAHYYFKGNVKIKFPCRCCDGIKPRPISSKTNFGHCFHPHFICELSPTSTKLLYESKRCPFRNSSPQGAWLRELEVSFPQGGSAPLQDWRTEDRLCFSPLVSVLLARSPWAGQILLHCGPVLNSWQLRLAWFPGSS